MIYKEEREKLKDEVNYSDITVIQALKKIKKVCPSAKLETDFHLMPLIIAIRYLDGCRDWEDVTIWRDSDKADNFWSSIRIGRIVYE